MPNTEITLNLIDRFNIINKLLPNKGSIVEMTTVKEILKKIEIRKQEMIDSEFVQQDGKISINAVKASGIVGTYEFNKTELMIINKSIDELDRSGSITSDLIDVIQKFKPAE
jgi:hypothetical protein